MGKCVIKQTTSARGRFNSENTLLSLGRRQDDSGAHHRFHHHFQLSYFQDDPLNMAKKKHNTRYLIGFQSHHGGHGHVSTRGSEPLPVDAAVLREELEVLHREMQRALTENRLVIEDNTLLQRELMAAKDETHRLKQAVFELQADREAQGKELIEMGMNLEVELRVREPLKTEVLQLRDEVHNLNALRQELSAKVQGLMRDIARVEAENQQLASVRADTDRAHEEFVNARRAFEYEKKAIEEQVGLRHRMENNLYYMAHGVEKLQAEHLNTNRREYEYCTFCPPCNYQNGGDGYGYGMLDESSEIGDNGSVYGDSYDSARGTYANHGRHLR